MNGDSEILSPCKHNYVVTIALYVKSYKNLFAASTSRRHLILWKYNSSGCITALKSKAPFESLAYSKNAYFTYV